LCTIKITGGTPVYGGIALPTGLKGQKG